MEKLELEAIALQNQRPSSLVTRAALQDAMRVLDENRALRQQLASAEGMLAAREHERQAHREAVVSQDLVMDTLHEEVAHLHHSRQCLREEVIEKRALYKMAGENPERVVAVMSAALHAIDSDLGFTGQHAASPLLPSE